MKQASCIGWLHVITTASSVFAQTAGTSGKSGRQPVALGTGDWPQFRGPGGSGTSDAKGLPVRWNSENNVVWKTALPGYGGSSPITVQERVFVTCYSSYGLDRSEPGDIDDLMRHVVCLDRNSGQILWTRDFKPLLPESLYESNGAWHGYSSSTPATDGERLYVFFGKSGVFCFDLEGQQLWQTAVGSRRHTWGSASSPVLYENLVIVYASVESRSLVALDKMSGKEVWRSEGIRESWNTPVLVEADAGKQELVVNTPDKLLAYDPQSGRPLWQCAGSDPPRYLCPSVIAKHGIVYAVNGFRGPVIAVRAGGRGDVTGSHRLWQVAGGSNVPSPVYHDGYLYWVAHSGGIAFCVDAEKGELVYRERLKPSPDLAYASPIVADGKLYYVSRQNGTYVLAAKPDFEILAHNTISTDQSVFNASPAVTGNRLLLRSDRFVYCIGEKP